MLKCKDINVNFLLKYKEIIADFLLKYKDFSILVVAAPQSDCLIREKVVTFRMVKLNMLLSIFLITK